MLLTAAVATWGLGACTLLVDASADQCASDADCARFGAVCDRASHLCIAQTSGGDGSAAMLGDGGATACVPRQLPAALDGCPAGTCLPFDNAVRRRNKGPNGGRRALP